MSYGHGQLGQTLLEHNLLDEIHFAIHPVLVGRGRVALRDNLRAELKLIESKTLANGGGRRQLRAHSDLNRWRWPMRSTFCNEPLGTLRRRPRFPT